MSPFLVTEQGGAKRLPTSGTILVAGSGGFVSILVIVIMFLISIAFF